MYNYHFVGKLFPSFIRYFTKEIKHMELKKYQVSINFEMDDEFMSLVPSHRTYINMLINKQVIDHYAVSMESLRAWITINAESKAAVDEYLSKSPLSKYWTYEIDELFVLDGLTYRLPHVQLN
ncbi:MAG: hypothetical protein EAZ16_01090 [Sphingobacteriales bacterium]|nr:MAG: hypothetical protein EAZ16_01090 [Sphingobacteriales bacterium]